ncbi:beta-lactamase [Carbonactinospora thermoautotrophica]|uniref:Beta-lactamase n=1 Tax=Carbonactinospora thermoautotrophica TaxID=1469144 RepID=A0A132NIX3_9ACTN|nr:MBL fold metallo-hydrolase [Carbonactinospora thermoautotrophica]KWX05245.1 beta-lactamase [Carbonactinospora thermoautotrophica]KWX10034.1 beta-lactamase [Carbonactinospora thermoautotrophica]
MERPVTTDLGNGVYAIDTRMHGYSGITAGYAILGDRPCLVETGTARSAPVVRDALAELGVGPHDLATIVVTHIHLDHAGGVGDLAKMFPNAQVVVHEAGARHLVDPEKLMKSARRVFGSLIDDLFGPLLPTEATRVVALGETGSVDLGGGRRLDSYYSPGHAKHHVGLVDSETGDLYVGDAAGIYVPETADVRPATPPPDFDLDVACASLQRFRELRPTRLLFSHFGPVTAVEETLHRSEEELRLWVELVKDARAQQMDLDHAVAMVRDKTKERYAQYLSDPEVEEKFEHLNSVASNIVGINRWLDQVEGREHPMADAASLQAKRS